MWLAYVNSIACVVLLGYIVPVAHIIDAHQNWGHRLALWLMTVALGLDAMTPFVGFLPPVPWTSFSLNVIASIAATVWRHEIWIFLRAQMHVPPTRPTNPRSYQ